MFTDFSIFINILNITPKNVKKSDNLTIINTVFLKLKNILFYANRTKIKTLIFLMSIGNVKHILIFF